MKEIRCLEYRFARADLWDRAWNLIFLLVGDIPLGNTQVNFQLNKFFYLVY